MNIPKLKSFKDLLLWIPRFLYYQDFKGHAILVTILAILPIYLATSERRHTPKGEVVKIENRGSMSVTGNFESGVDSVYLKKGSEVRLLARQRGAFWAETADGKYRGFLSSDVVGKEVAKEVSLATRERMSCRLITKGKFSRIVERNSLTKIQKKYINAEYIKTKGGKTIAEFGFKVFVDNEGQKMYMRPIVTYDSEGKYLSHELVYWQPARAKLVSSGIVNLFGSMASVSEFPRVSPFDSLLLEKMWCYLPGLLLLGIFALLLVLRTPLAWAPNSLVNLLLYTLALVPPFMWLSVIKSYGLSWWFSLFYIIIMLVNVLLLWTSYSGLRCPNCKHLNYHEFSDKRKGKSYWETHRKAHEQSRGPKQHEQWGLWEVGEYRKNKGLFDGVSREARTDDPSQWTEDVHYRKHSWDQVVTFRDYVTNSHIQEVVNSYKCPHCGHGTEDIEKSCVDKVEEWAPQTYTKHLYYTEKVANDGRVFDHECKER